MSKSPMAKFVCENRYNFLCLRFLDKSVVDDDMFLPGHPEEVSIAVCTAFASVNDIELMKRKLEPRSQRFDTSFQVAGLEGCQFVEKWENCNRIDCDHENL